jgi:hypothetical protein
MSQFAKGYWVGFLTATTAVIWGLALACAPAVKIGTGLDTWHEEEEEQDD